MIASPESACLVIADVSGYTAYLAGVELDHAQDILADLTDAVVAALRPAFRLAKIEGDAVFVHRPADTVDASLLQDSVEGCYFAFRRRLRDIAQATRCQCNACLLMPSLDLKVVAHVGAVGRQRVAGREELVGRDVIVVHRLLKNEIRERLGVPAYALYTDPCLRALGVDPSATGLIEHRETYDVIGEVVGWVRDLAAAWTDEQERARVIVSGADAYRVYTADIAAPPQVVWELMTSPVRRPQWGAGIDTIHEVSGTGRRGSGTVNHCVHGKDAIVEEILDWRPYEHWTTRATLPDPRAPKVVMSDVLTETSTGTRIEVRVGPPAVRRRAAFEQLMPMLEPMILASQAGLTTAAEEETARRVAVDAGQPNDPVRPGSSSRHLSQPVDLGPAGVDPTTTRSSS
jgi:uncharacterized protein YndB with AHSA1/START domain